MSHLHVSMISIPDTKGKHTISPKLLVADISIQGSQVNSFHHTSNRAAHPLIDGVEGETSDTPRPLKTREIAEWILLDGVRVLSSIL